MAFRHNAENEVMPMRSKRNPNLWIRLNQEWENNLKGNRDTVWLKNGASFPGTAPWRSMLPCGNGETGAMTDGSAGVDTILITRHDLWAGVPVKKELPDLTLPFQEMRRRIDSGDYLSAQNLMTDALEADGYLQPTAVPFPLGELHVHTLHTNMPFSSYRRGIHMDRGECFAQWRYDESKSLRRLFVSRADKFLYYNIRDEQKKEYLVELTFANGQDGRNPAVKKEIQASLFRLAKGHCIYYGAAVEKSSFGAVLKIFPEEGTVVPTEDRKGLLLKGRSFTICLATFAKEKKETAFRRIFRELNALSPECPYENALDAHQKLHMAIYKDVDLCLADEEECAFSNEKLLDDAYDSAASPALLERLWRFGRYIFLCGTGRNCNPFALYGLWPGEYELPWCQNVGNENIQMIYWHAMAGGFPEAVEAMIIYYTDQIEAFRENAQKLFGCRGIYVPGYTAPTSLGGIPSNGPGVNYPVILNWISCAGWLCRHMMEYANYSGDKEFIERHILPFITETARFYADYVQWKDGVCRIIPSVSPENTPKNLMPENFHDEMAHACPVVYNATMDFAVMKDVLEKALLLCSLFSNDISEEEQASWKTILEGIPAYMLNQDGAVKEWMAEELEDQYAHRHLSHLYPVFPGDEITYEKDRKSGLFQAFEKAAKYRKMESRTGWSFVHSACIHNRFRQGEQALEYLDMLVKSCVQPNLFTVHNDWRHMGLSMDLGNFSPIQLDALLGAVHVLQEMLVWVCRDTVYILPAFCRRLSHVRLKGLHIPGGRIDMEVAEGKWKIKVRASRLTVVRLVNPDLWVNNKLLFEGSSCTLEGRIDY